MSVRDHSDVPMQWVGADKPIEGTEAWQDHRAHVETYDDQPDHCTIYPRDADREERLSAWVSADAPDFVDPREEA